MLRAFVLAICLASAAGAQTTVRVRPSAAPAPGPVRLADVASISGPDADVLGAIVIVTDDDPQPASQIDLALIRARLKQAPGVNMGRIALSGTACAIRHADPAPPPPSVASPTPHAPATETVRDRVAAVLAHALGVTPADLRLSFDASDAELLAWPAAGYTLAVQPTGSGDRVPVSVRAYRADLLVKSGSIRVGVLVRRTVPVTRDAIARGKTVLADDLILAEHWLPPTATPASPTTAIGAQARRTLRAGAVIEAADVEPPIVVRRGEVIGVDCLSGGIVLRTQARAMESARAGESVRFQSLGSKREFRARVSGPGHAAVVAADAPDAPDLRPPSLAGDLP